MKGYTIAPGIKATRLDDLPEEAWAYIRGEGSDEAQKLYKAVAWLYRAVDIRGQAVAGMPWELRRGDTIITSSDEAEQPEEWAWLTRLSPLLYRTEAATVLEGKAYWLKERQGPPRAEGLRWLLPSSITPKYSESAGVTGFVRRVGQRDVSLKLQEIVYFWPPDPFVEIGPQRNTPGAAAMSASDTLHNLELFTSGYFERGAVKATLLTYQEMISDDEKSRVKEWWQRVVAGIKNAWSNEVVRGDFEPVIIGEGLESLANTELTELEREAICTALGVPQSKLTANAANFATKQSDDVMFITDTVSPRCEWMQGVLNEQLFAPLGVYFRFLPDTLSVMQEDEEQRAASLLNLVSAGMNLEMAVEVLGYDLPEGVELREPKREAPDTGPVMPPTGDPREPQEPEEVTNEKAVFKRWLKNRDNPNPDDFETDLLSRQQKAMVMLEAGIYPGGRNSEDSPFGKATRSDRDPLNPDGRKMRRMEREFTEAVYDAFQRLKRALRQNLTAENVSQMLMRLDKPDVIQPFRDTITAQVQAVALAGAEFGREQIEREVFGVKRVEDALDVGVWDIANNDASAWALDYSYELVRGIEQTTRDRLAKEIDQFIQNKETLPQFVERLEPVFGKTRAELIGVTEVTRSFAEGNLAAWRATGIIERKRWNTANDELVCPLCGPRAGMVVGIDESFDGIDGPPAHPRCRCSISPVVVFEDEDGN